VSPHPFPLCLVPFFPLFLAFNLIAFLSIACGSASVSIAVGVIQYTALASWSMRFLNFPLVPNASCAIPGVSL
jgi:hypothetical protein